MSLSLDDIGLQDGDIAISVVPLEGGSIEVRARLSAHGVAIIEGLTASYDLSPHDLFGRVIRQALMVKAGRS